MPRYREKFMLPNSPLKVRLKVVDKHFDCGWLWDTYTVVLQPDDVCIKGNQIISVEVPVAQYYNLNIGETYLVKMYLHSDGRLYLKPEDEDCGFVPFAD